jgi:hypothetical protein
MSKAIFCIVPGYGQALRIVEDLRAAGFANQDISVLMPDKTGSRDFAHEQKTKAPEGASVGAGAGGILGGAMGLLAGIGTLAIPGVGAFVAAGPLMAALGGAAVGAAVGGLAGTLIGLGMPEFEAKRYEGKIRGGNVLISVHLENGDEGKRAREIFERAGAEDITTSSEASVPKSAR